MSLLPPTKLHDCHSTSLKIEKNTLDHKSGYKMESLEKEDSDVTVTLE